ncbi:uncharacterized protein LOC143924531 isoform X2 [Lithobates pipiens]
MSVSLPRGLSHHHLFVQQQAKIRCDPSFSFITNSQLPKAEKPPRAYNRTSVIAHKTTVTSEDPDCLSSYKFHKEVK